MNHVNKEFIIKTPLPVLPLSPYMQEIIERELSDTDQKVKQVFVPSIGRNRNVKK